MLCVANKTDAPSLDPQADEFYRFGRKVIRVSAEQNRGKDELWRDPGTLPPPDAEAAADEPTMKSPSSAAATSGKSTFVNTLAQAERMIVSEVPGTTRDSVDVRFELDGKAFVAIDTPGFRRGKSIATDIDFYSTHRAQRSIRRADVVLLFFDASQRISKVDKQLCDYVAQQYKPCIFVVNKWDLLTDTMPTEKWVTYLRDTFRTMLYAPIAFITGQTGKNVKALLNHAQMLFKQSRMRIGTAQLNKLVRGPGAEPAADRASRRPANLLRHPGGGAAADDRLVLQRRPGDFAAVSAISSGRVPREVGLRRSAHQAVSPPAGEERPPRRNRRKDRQSARRRRHREEADADQAGGGRPTGGRGGIANSGEVGAIDKQVLPGRVDATDDGFRSHVLSSGSSAAPPST